MVVNNILEIIEYAIDNPRILHYMEFDPKAPLFIKLSNDLQEQIVPLKISALNPALFALRHKAFPGFNSKHVDYSKAWFSNIIKTPEGHPEMFSREINVFICPWHYQQSQRYNGKLVKSGFCGE